MSHNVTMNDFEEYEWVVYKRGYLSMRAWSNKPNTPRVSEGTFTHPRGMIKVYRYEDTGNNVARTTLNFIFNGIEYNRRWNASWADNTVSRLCREFMLDLESTGLFD